MSSKQKKQYSLEQNKHKNIEVEQMCHAKIQDSPKHEANSRSFSETSTLDTSKVFHTQKLKDIYKLNSKILTGTPITEHMRARLRSFLMSECSKQNILRETYCLACTLMDLYFMRGGSIQIAQFQIFSISCLILATKLLQDRFPTISFQSFNREQLLSLEKRVSLKLNYALSPLTYYAYAQQCIEAWNSFSADKIKFNKSFSEQAQGANLKLRTFYQQLDSVFMVMKTLDYKMQEIILNFLFIKIYIINSEEVDLQKISSQQCIKNLLAKEEFRQLFNQFLQKYFDNEWSLNQEISLYLSNFITLSPVYRLWRIKTDSQGIHKMRRWDMVQTFPKDSYVLVKQVMKRYPRMPRETP